MEETATADYSQFDFAQGASSCTSAAVLFARYSLEGIPSREELNKILEAAALLWGKWKETDRSCNSFQTWKNVESTLPIVFCDVDIVHEANGFFGAGEGDSDYLLTTVSGCIDKLCEGDCRGMVITSNSASYGLAHREGAFYFFDSHGCPGTRGRAYVTRLGSPRALSQFVSRNMPAGAEFTAVIVQKRAPDTGDTQSSA